MNLKTTIRLALLVVAAVVAISAARGVRPAYATTCAPPHGPGDNLVHSHGLRAHNLSCRKARVVALDCTRFTFGHSGNCSAVGRSWHCTSHHEGGLGSAQRCVSGSRSMTIHWDD